MLKQKRGQKIQTKRSSLNKHNTEKHQGYAVRMQNRDKYFSLRNKSKREQLKRGFTAPINIRYIQMNGWW